MSSTHKPWTRVIGEGLAIVASILLAFGIDAAWDGLQERAEAREILEGLHREASSNLLTLETSLDTLAANWERLSRFVQSTPDDYAEDFGDSAWVAVVRPQYRTFSPTLSYAFLDATIGAVKLELIRDVDLRASLAGLNALQERADAPLGGLIQLSREAAILAAVHPEIQRGFTAEPSARVISASTLRALRTDEDLVRLASARLMFTLGYIRQSEALVGELRLVVRAIEEELRKLE